MLARILGVVAVVAAVLVAAVWWEHRDLSASALEAQHVTEADRFIDVDGLRMRVRESGPEGAPPLILAHGFSYSLETWEGWAEALDDEFRIIRFDLAGHGLTGPDAQERYAPTDHAAAFGAVMDALGIDSAYVGGNSLGGLAAWRFAAVSPQRVEKLVLVDPGAYSINGVTDEPAEVPGAMKVLLTAAPRAGVRAVLTMSVADPEVITRERAALARDMLRREGNGKALVRTLELFTLPDPEADLAGIAAPTLILWGERDGLVPVAHGRRMAEVMPQASLITYSEIGHTPQEEDPSGTAADVRAFLQAG